MATAEDLNPNSTVTTCRRSAKSVACFPQGVPASGVSVAVASPRSLLASRRERHRTL